MTAPPEGWRAQLEPAPWLTCRVGPAEPPRDADGRPDDRDWLCADPADADPGDACLSIMAGWGGGGKYHHTEVVEAQQAVYVLVFIEHWVPAVPRPGVAYVRTTELRRAIIEVQLSGPVGERTLLGSVGPSSSWGRMHFPADRRPIDSVTSRPQPEASAQATDLIARFEDLQLIQATHHALADMRPRPDDDAKA